MDQQLGEARAKYRHPLSTLTSIASNENCVSLAKVLVHTSIHPFSSASGTGLRRSSPSGIVCWDL